MEGELLGTQVDGQNDPVCLIRERERKKNKTLCSPLIHAVASCHGNSSIVNADGSLWGFLSVSLSLFVCLSSGALRSLIFYAARL